MKDRAVHRLNGFDPDNLLAFLALLGLLRSLEEAQTGWCPRVFWTVDKPPLRPALRVRETVEQDTVLEAVAKGLNALAQCHDFGALSNLALSPEYAAGKLRTAAAGARHGRYTADLWSALVSDAATSRDGKKVEPTPLCLMFGQGHQHFLSRLASVPKEKTPPERGGGPNKIKVSESDCLREALFAPWRRPDATSSFRWDPNEDVRYALRARDPTDAATKETTQHGANRLASVGLSVLTVVPRLRSGEVRLAIPGGAREAYGGFAFGWPIWRHPMSLAGIRALLAHPHLDRPEVRSALGVVEHRWARRISPGRFMNFTRAGS